MVDNTTGTVQGSERYEGEVMDYFEGQRLGGAEIRSRELPDLFDRLNEDGHATQILELIAKSQENLSHMSSALDMMIRLEKSVPMPCSRNQGGSILSGLIDIGLVQLQVIKAEDAAANILLTDEGWAKIGRKKPIWL